MPNTYHKYKTLLLWLTYFFHHHRSVLLFIIFSCDWLVMLCKVYKRRCQLMGNMRTFKEFWLKFSKDNWRILGVEKDMESIDNIVIYSHISYFTLNLLREIALCELKWPDTYEQKYLSNVTLSRDDSRLKSQQNNQRLLFKIGQGLLGSIMVSISTVVQCRMPSRWYITNKSLPLFNEENSESHFDE